LDSGAPVGATINPATGFFSWTPSDAQGPSTNSITVRVTDNGTPQLSATRTFTVIVTELNDPPVLDSITDRTINEGSLLSFVANAHDPDLPPQALTFTLEPGAPAGAQINATNGLFTWTPNEAQGPGTNSITVRVTDDGSPTASATATFTVIVNEVNTPPSLTAIPAQTVIEGQPLTFTAIASETDLPGQALTFSLEPGAPAGALINGTSGLFAWTPTEAQGPSTNTVTIRVTDNGTPPLSATQNVSIVVFESNSPPVFSFVDVQNVDEGTPLSFLASASDPDIPAQQLSYALSSDAPIGLVINSSSGQLSWIPAEKDGPATNTFAVYVTDNGIAPLSATQQVTIIVHEVNQAPSINPISSQRVSEGNPLTFLAVATDADEPAQNLTFSLDPGVAAGASIDPVSGLFSWTPGEIQGPSTNILIIRVTDDGSPSLSATTFVTIVVDELNTAPSLAHIGDQTTPENVPWSPM